MASNKRKQPGQGRKTFADRRTANPPQADAGRTSRARTGEPLQQQDPKRRLGHFETAGEHARTGTRHK